MIALVLVGDVPDESVQAISGFFANHGFVSDEVERGSDALVGSTVSLVYRAGDDGGDTKALLENLGAVLGEHLPDGASACGAIAS